MILFKLKYKGKDPNSTTLLNHTLFGRINKTNYLGRKYAYYTPGMLHNKEYIKINRAELFMKDLEDIDFDMLNIFGKVSTEQVSTSCNQPFKTGEEHWKGVAEEKECLLKIKKRSQYVRNK